MSRQSLPPSVADTLPNINFGFDELRDRMAKFTAKFDAFIEQGRKRVLEERNQFHMSIAEIRGMVTRPLSIFCLPLYSRPATTSTYMCLGLATRGARDIG